MSSTERTPGISKKESFKVRNRWDRLRITDPQYDTPENSATQQQFKEECDMNRIVENAKRGIPPKFTNRGQPHYGDFSEVPDLTTAYNQIARAEEAFQSLPAQLRLELGNDPRNINKLSVDQIERYKLGKRLPEPGTEPEGSTLPSPADPASKGRAGPPKGDSAHKDPVKKSTDVDT